MLKKLVKIVLAAAMVLLASGCWDALDVEDRDIVTAVVVDYRDGKYAYHVEITTISSKTQGVQSVQESGQGLSTMIVHASGETFAQARINLDKLLNKPIFLGAVQALIITERMADNGIEEYAYRIRQMIEYRKTMDVIVTTDEPEDFLNVIPENESTVGFAVEDTMDKMIEMGGSFHMSLADLLEKLAGRNPCFLLSTVSIVNEQLCLIGYTVFSGGYRMGFIPYDQARGAVYIALGQSHKGTPKFDYVVPLGDEYVALETELSSINITPVYEGGVVGFDVKMSFKATILYPSFRHPLTPEIEDACATELSRQLLEEISQTIALSQSYGCDYLSFSEPFRIRFPDIFEQMDWKSEFKKAVFSIHVDVEIGQNESVDYNPYAEGGGL